MPARASFLLSLLVACGCGSQSLQETEIKARQAEIWVDTFRGLGADVNAAVLIGDGHLAGQAFNLSGSHVAVMAHLRGSPGEPPRAEPPEPPEPVRLTP